ncbi:MAG: Uma2 family endonuclease [Glycomyces artemisiae]|uniref:Uma2 family endonuclease n=1 Tax=Glycomyces artemisiae TaxID=1076443 RepID=A0A850CH13_9ACTN|nr:Uma2 family endonuclease [Glycomyces artemisiae]
MAAAEPLADAEPAGSDELWKAWETLDVPPGFRAEIIRGDIVLSPSPTNRHSHIIAQLNRQMSPLAHEQGWYLANELGVRISHTGEALIPDLMVVPETVLDEQEEASAIDSADLLLAVEVTSDSSVRRDRKTKLWSYAYGMIPVYLLVDRHDGEGTVTVYSEPDGNGTYVEHQQVAFGKPIALPDPIGIEIDTGRFTPRVRKA